MNNNEMINNAMDSVTEKFKRAHNRSMLMLMAFEIRYGKAAADFVDKAFTSIFEDVKSATDETANVLSTIIRAEREELAQAKARIEELEDALCEIKDEASDALNKNNEGPQPPEPETAGQMMAQASSEAKVEKDPEASFLCSCPICTAARLDAARRSHVGGCL